MTKRQFNVHVPLIHEQSRVQLLHVLNAQLSGKDPKVVKTSLDLYLILHLPLHPHRYCLLYLEWCHCNLGKGRGARILRNWCILNMANIICYFSKQKLDYTLEHVCALREHWDILTCFNIGLCYKNSYIVSWKHIPSWASIRAIDTQNERTLTMSFTLWTLTISMRYIYHLPWMIWTFTTRNIFLKRFHLWTIQ